MPLTVEEIKARRFTTVRLREGYDVDEVDEFLAEVEKTVAHYDEATEQLLAAVRDAAASPTPVGSGAVTDVASASRAAARMLEVATAEAETVVSEARAQAAELLADAHGEVELLRAQAARERSQEREESERRRAAAREAAAAEQAQHAARLRDLRDLEASFRADIEARLRTQLDLLSGALPDVPAAPAPAAASSGVAETRGFTVPSGDGAPGEDRRAPDPGAALD